MEVAFVVFPGWGHVSPCLQLLRFFSQHASSCHVTVFTQFTTEEVRRLEAKVKWTTDCYDIVSMDENDVDTGANTLLFADRNNTGYLTEYCINYYTAKNIKPDVLIQGQLVSWGASVAKHFAIPLWLFLASPLFAIPLYNNNVDKENTELPIIGKLNSFEHLDLPPDPLKTMFVHFSSCIDNCDGIIVNDTFDWYATEFREWLGKLISAPLIPVGPLCLYEPRNTPANLHIDRWLKSQWNDSVIFVSMGSWCEMSANEVVELAYGLQETKAPVLWALRPKTNNEVLDNLFHCDRSTIEESVDPITLLPIGFREKHLHQFTIVDWVDQVRVLENRAVGLFVTHCGWNGLVESLTFRPDGLPIVTLPLGAEQVINSTVVTQWFKTGLPLWRSRKEGSLRRATVTKIVKEVMRNRKYKQRAAELHKVAINHGLTVARANSCGPIKINQ